MNEKVKVKAGELLFTEGDTGDCMYVINDGVIEIYRETSNDRVVLARLEHGDFFGEMAIVGRTTRTANAKALTNSSVTVFKGSELEDMIIRRPEVVARMIVTLIQRVRSTTDKLIDEHERLGLALRTESFIGKN